MRDYIRKEEMSTRRLEHSVQYALARDRYRKLELELRQQLRKAETMEAIGQLASGVAHDLNNILTGIGGFTELALAKISPEHSAFTSLTQIKKAADRAGTLTGQLLAFGGQQVLHPRVVEPNSVLANLEDLLRSSIGEDVELVMELAPDSGRVEIDLGQMEQVLVNLAMNARDAMPGGGRLRLETANVELDEDPDGVEFEPKPRRYVRIRVADSGHGMDEKTQRRIFEPLFTTKELGKGTGLGLSMVYGVVRQSGGHIEVDSEPGRGATFSIFLPRVREVAGPTSRARQGGVSGETERGCDRILLVDDDQLVRLIVTLTLESEGYEVLVAETPNQAFDICERLEDLPDLLLTDVLMPGTSGPNLAREISDRHGELKVLYMSGYSTQDLRDRGVLASEGHFLSKPFNSRELTAKVRGVLDCDLRTSSVQNLTDLLDQH